MAWRDESIHLIQIHLIQIHLIQQTEIWVPTLLGWLLLLSGSGLIGWLLVKTLYPFLSVNAPLEADILVVDGWMPDDALKQVYDIFEQGAYRQIVAIGPPISRGHYLTDYKTYADVAVATLTAMGISTAQIIPVAVPLTTQHRTYAGAILLKQWLNTQPQIRSINLCTLGAHARRSRLLFRQNLAPTVRVGVIALSPLDYNPDQWWRYSAGGRAVIGELIGYGYACCTLPWISQSSNWGNP